MRRPWRPAQRSWWGLSTLTGSAEAVERFVARNLRQVWARHRVTGEAVFIAPGTATAVRETARAEWSCLVPGCDVLISTRGGSRRDHFFHVAPVEHPGGPESVHHLAAKAMLAQWASAKVGDGAQVIEERTIKNAELGLHRRPDVLVTWNDGQRAALEVEYKRFPPDAWRSKQDDLDRENVTCSWLIGHTRVTADTAEPTLVRVPGLVGTLAASGRHPLVVNPVTRQIGTLAASDHSKSLSQWSYLARLHIDDLDDCDLDPHAGLVTPAMRQLDEERRKTLAAEEALEKLRSKALQGRWYEYERRWELSPERKRMFTRWGEVPTLLTSSRCGSDCISALPVHWRAVLYEAHVHGQPWAHLFTIGDCYDTLANASIGWNGSASDRYRAITSFLSNLEAARLIEPAGKYRWRKYRDLNWWLRQAPASASSSQNELAQQRFEVVHPQYTKPSPWCYGCGHAMPADKADWDPHLGHDVR